MICQICTFENAPGMTQCEICENFLEVNDGEIIDLTPVSSLHALQAPEDLPQAPTTDSKSSATCQTLDTCPRCGVSLASENATTAQRCPVCNVQLTNVKKSSKKRNAKSNIDGPSRRLSGQSRTEASSHSQSTEGVIELLDAALRGYGLLSQLVLIFLASM
jgi:hypothetical protein